MDKGGSSCAEYRETGKYRNHTGSAPLTISGGFVGELSPYLANAAAQGDHPGDGMAAGRLCGDGDAGDLERDPQK